MTTSLNFSLPFDRSKLDFAETRVKRELERRREKSNLEDSFSSFVAGAWAQIDVSEYKQTWAIDALCDHLQAVTEGHIQRLLINYPPRGGKTNVASICWPAWTWARRQRSFTSGAGVRFLCGSYNHDLSLINSNKTRRLIASPWYQERWGKRFDIRVDQNTKTQFDNTEGGSRIATSVGGSLLGIGGDILDIDDPHNVEGAESEAERLTTANWMAELKSTRINDPKRGAIAVTMQRLHEDDTSGQITRGEGAEEWTHLMIPMEYEWRRHCVTVLKWDEQGEPEKVWQDPRGLDEEGEPLVVISDEGDRVPRNSEAQIILDEEREGTLLWPDRAGPKEVATLKRELGPYRASGRLQQIPAMAQGGIFKREWWTPWEPEDGKWPSFDFLLAYADTAFTENEENDPTGCTVWGVFAHPENKRPQVMLVKAWRKHLEMHGELTEKGPDESVRAWLRRSQPKWGLCEWLAETCRFRASDGRIIGTVDRLIIEAKASGISAAQEMQRIYKNDPWITMLDNVKGDKVARAHAAVPAWSQGLVWAPDRDWVDMVVDEMAVFPKGRYKDLTDSATGAIKFLRQNGFIMRPDEIVAEEHDKSLHRKRKTALYPV